MPNPSLKLSTNGVLRQPPSVTRSWRQLSSNIEAVKKRFSRIPRWITQKINATKQRMRDDLAQGKEASTLEVIGILRIVWFFYSLVRSHKCIRSAAMRSVHTAEWF